MEEQNVSNEEVVQQQPVQEEAPQQDVALPEIQQQPVAQAHASNAAEVNFQKMREAKERAEREAAELRAQLEEQNKPQYEDNDLVEGKHLRQEVSSLKEQMEESRLRSRYTDFDKVINSDTIAKLKEADPEFAETIGSSQASLYARGAATYKRVKELGLFVEDNHEKDRARAQDNAAKPRPLNSVSPQQGDSPLSVANAFQNGLTPELKRQLWKEMQDASKRH